jgi:molybdenum cofactor cytidylyltransferase
MISAVILAAGKSTRMGHPKMLLPWGNDQSILGRIIYVFTSAGIEPVIIVTGADRKAIEESLAEMHVELVYNPDFDEGEMISSVKVGLLASEKFGASAAMVCPGDLPLLKSATVNAVIEAWKSGGKPIVAPSYQGRRGHPLLISNDLWADILSLTSSETLREFLTGNSDLVSYAVVDDPGVIHDMDTSEDYKDALDLML